MAASTRLGRKVAEAVAAYRSERDDVRARFESGLISAADCLKSSEEIGKPTRTALLEAVAMVFAEGYVGGSWRKVHAALAEVAPELYKHVKDLIPDAGSADHPLAL